MADSYGALQIPVQVPAAGEEITDPAISLTANYLKAVLNAKAQAAWSRVAPPIVMATATITNPVVRKVFGHNPLEESFNEDDLPAIYLWRGPKGEKPFWMAEDYRVSPDKWTLLWLLRPAQQDGRRIRQSFINGVAKIIDVAIESQRDPVFVATADTDPTAATTPAAPTAIKLAVASSLTAQSYSGAALDGAIGGGSISPARLPTVTVTGTGCTGTVLFTGIGEDGIERVSRVDVSGTGTFTGDFALSQITQIDVPAQGNTTSTLTFGLAAFDGLGSNVFELGHFLEIEVEGWEETVVTIQMSDTSPPRPYEGIKITFAVIEKWDRDTSTLDGSEASPQFTDGTTNDYVRETALFT